MSAVVPTVESIQEKIRAVLRLEGKSGQAGEVVLNLGDQPGSDRPFRTALVELKGVYAVTVSTDECFFMSMRPDDSLLVHAGPQAGTQARFLLNRPQEFYCRYTPTDSEYTFIEKGPTGETQLTVTIHW
ncbi:MAG: hypothetical protein ACM3XM_00575 [Mycobacterium leprae]